MAQVGFAGDSGVIGIQDLLFTNVGPTAGLVMVEWNVAQLSAGSAAMWHKNTPSNESIAYTNNDIRQPLRDRRGNRDSAASQGLSEADRLCGCKMHSRPNDASLDIHILSVPRERLGMGCGP